ncbi:GNAT family N-acetyltransferase [Xylanibacillus composti]|uniref:N-acetyltransferase domain-containing protein n=1 Tax=Xylanibacillus composti TaxID=1572762 RepID=A0A8J4H132_9BACL|nr:GNAT family N-acetyltransferase [Xylanibacillus composti]MDT9725542.1 GNAT family N-acetyltransferase [Xylanibacillus composti]GIQ67636.1 hypothetical protein XYCOK13_04600 [Xylanibacillus composti]
MIRSRKPGLDDPMIYRLTRLSLLPYTRRHFPDMKLSRNSVRERLQNGVTLVKRSGGRFKGFVHFLVRGESLWIDLLAVRKLYRRSGIGEQLMQKAEDWGRRKGARQAMLYVNVENEGAKRFYQRRGYRYAHTDRKLHCDLFVKPLVADDPA